MAITCCIDCKADLRTASVYSLPHRPGYFCEACYDRGIGQTPASTPPGEVCPDCKGTGRYTGLTNTGPCMGPCSGTGRTVAWKNGGGSISPEKLRRAIAEANAILNPLKGVLVLGA